MQQHNQIGYIDMPAWKKMMNFARFLLIIFFRESISLLMKHVESSNMLPWLI